MLHQQYGKINLGKDWRVDEFFGCWGKERTVWYCKGVSYSRCDTRNSAVDLPNARHEYRAAGSSSASWFSLHLDDPQFVLLLGNHVDAKHVMCPARRDVFELGGIIYALLYDIIAKTL